MSTPNINNEFDELQLLLNLKQQPLRSLDFDNFYRSISLNTDNFDFKYQTPDIGTNKYFFKRTFEDDSVGRQGVRKNMELEKMKVNEDGLKLELKNNGGPWESQTTKLYDCIDLEFFNETGVGFTSVVSPNECPFHALNDSCNDDHSFY